LKSAQLTGIRKFEIRDIEKPTIINPNDVLLRIGALGICGSDVHYFVDGRIGDQVLSYPVTPGHEFSAVVDQVGPNVASLKPGNRVAVEPAVSCGKCDQCKCGRQNTCRALKFTGAPNERPGATSEFLVMPEENCFKIPDSMSLAQAACAEPLSIAIYALNYLNGRKIETAAILGAGPIGQCVLLDAKYRGIPKVYITDKLDERLKTAQKAGADWIGNPDKNDVVKEMLAQEPLQFDAVIECSGDPAALDQGMELLKPGGTLVIVGIPEDNRISFDMNLMRRREITIQPVRRQNECLGLAVERIASGQINIDYLISHRGGLEDTQRFYELAAAYDDGVLKAVIEL
jgi:L-iditol 2-dehydrogenase